MIGLHDVPTVVHRFDLQAARLRLRGWADAAPAMDITDIHPEGVVASAGQADAGFEAALLALRVRKEIKVADRAEILSILQGAKSEHIEYM